MYNIDFLPQMEKFERSLLAGTGCLSTRDLPREGVYHLPAGMKIIPCHEDTNGEWVPDQEGDSSLEESVIV